MGTLLWRAFSLAGDMDLRAQNGLRHELLFLDMSCLLTDMRGPFSLPTDTTDCVLHFPSELDLSAFSLSSCRGCAHGLNLARNYMYRNTVC